ncbi:MAG: guanylate kinase [Verrucomicrobia bacterium]|nr:guanylate kinase [Verrucomicrobiota bacterium]
MTMKASNPSPLLILISAPSGGGKTTLCEQLLAAHPEITRAVTCTTRAPRTGERDGVDYHFLAPVDFQSRVAAGEFIEHANVYGNRYGTLKSEVLEKLRAGRDVLLNIDVQGAASIRARADEDAELGRALVSIFLTPASLAILEERLKRRGKDSPEAVQTRLGHARREIAEWKHFDYLVISTSVAEDLRRTQSVLEAERMRQRRAVPPEL